MTSHSASTESLEASRTSSGVKHAVQRQFSAAAGAYLHSAVHASHPDLDALLAAAVLDPTTRVLDVGCGTGHTSFAMAARGAQVVGVDLTPAMLEQGRMRAQREGVSNIAFEQGDAEALPYASASFDVVACRLCAHHFQDLTRAVREMARVLRPGGQLLLSDSVAPEDAASDTFLNCIELLRDPSHVRNYRLSEWRESCTSAGLSFEPLGAFPMQLDFESWFARMATAPSHREAILSLFAGAPREIQKCFGWSSEDASTWQIPIAAFRATRPPAELGAAH